MTENSGPGRVWNRIPDDIRRQIVEMALDEPDLSPRELAVTFTDREGYFVPEASVYRLLKAHDPIASPAFVVIKAADTFKDKTTAPNQLWQTDFTYLKVIGWGWLYLSTSFNLSARFARNKKTVPVNGSLCSALFTCATRPSCCFLKSTGFVATTIRTRFDGKIMPTRSAQKRSPRAGPPTSLHRAGP